MQHSQIAVDKSSGFVFLTIRNGYKNCRRIGSIKGDTFHCSKNRNKHILRLHNAIGVTSGLFDMPEVKYFCIKLDGLPLWIKKDYADRVKIEMHWHKPELEKQYFIAIDEFSSTREQAERINNFELTESLTLF